MDSIDQEMLEAAEENSLPEVRRLLRAGADVNAKDTTGVTPLIGASDNGHVQVVKELLGHGADIAATDNEDWTPLHYACLNGHSAVVIELLGPNDSNNGETASILGKRKSRGADTESKNGDGDTPLLLASGEGHLAAVKALLNGGANILAAGDQGRLPIHIAVSRGHSEVAKCLLQQFYATIRHLPLHELLKDLTWIGDTDSIDCPLLRAALHQNVLGTDDVVEILEYLVKRNPELVCSRDHYSSLPLHVACRRGASFSIVQSLVNHFKASVKSATSDGDLPLFLACEIPKPSLDTIFLLVKLTPDLLYGCEV
jgi:ankyrin repeat protein